MKRLAKILLAGLLISQALPAQNVTVGPNLEVGKLISGGTQLIFATDAAKTYQIEISGDLVHWDPEGYAFRGTGGRMTAVVSNRSLDHAFYRLRDDASPENAAPYGPYGPYGLSSMSAPPGPEGSGAQASDSRDVVEPPVLPRTLKRLLANKQSGSPRAFRLRYLMLGDSYALDLADELSAKVAPLREQGFGNTMTLGGNAVFDQHRFDYAPNGNTWVLSGGGQTVQYGIGAAAEIECYRIKVFYSMAAGGGSFALETNTRGAGWVEVPGATTASPVNSDNGGAISAGVFTYSFPSTEPRKVRAKWVSGNARILGFVLSDIRDEPGSNRGGCAVYNLARGGINVADGRLTPQSVWNVILRDLQPDFCSYKSDDSEHLQPFAEFYEKVQEAHPMDWVMVSRHPSNAVPYALQGPPANSGNELLQMDVQLRDFALSKGQLFVNGRSMFPDNATMIELGLTTDGNAHLTPTGDNYQHQIVMNILASALQPSSQLPSASAVDLEKGARYRDTPLGIVAKSGPGLVFDLLGTTGSGVNFRPFFAISKIDDSGTTGFHQGPANRCFAVIDPQGRMLFSNSAEGWQTGVPASWNRAGNGMMELFAGDRSSESTLALSGTAAHTGDLFAVFKNATATSQGTRAAGIKADGAADFGRLKASIPPYANHAAADADAGLLSGQLYKLNAGRTVYQKP